MNYGIIYTALSGILYGSIGYFGSTLLANGLSLPSLLLWRFLLSAIMLLPLSLTWIRKRPHFDFKNLGLLFILGAIFYGGSTALYFEASKSIGTGLAMVIFFAYPIFVVLFSTILHKSHFSMIMLASLLLIVLGCALISVGGHFAIDLYGIGLAVLSGAGYGVYVFFSKEASRTISPGLGTLVVCLGGVAWFAVAAFIFDGYVQIPSTTFLWVNASLFSLMGTVLPVMLMLLGLKTISASKASIISVLEPVTTLMVGALILGENISTLQYVGVFIILSSAIFVQLDKESH
jgi:drug/metabolite transporter (DMT)-like permease